MERSARDFAFDCTPEECKVFAAILRAFNSLMHQFRQRNEVSQGGVDIDPDHGFSLTMAHPKLLQGSQATIIRGYPDAVDADDRRSGLFTRTSALAAAWVPHSVIDDFGAALEQQAGFVRRRDWQDWRTAGAGEREGICRWHRADADRLPGLVRAVRLLVERINGLPGDAPQPTCAYVPRVPPTPD
jgi:hypothetical protein